MKNINKHEKIWAKWEKCRTITKIIRLKCYELKVYRQHIWKWIFLKRSQLKPSTTLLNFVRGLDVESAVKKKISYEFRERAAVKIAHLDDNNKKKWRTPSGVRVQMLDCDVVGWCSGWRIKIYECRKCCKTEKKIVNNLKLNVCLDRWSMHF